MTERAEEPYVPRTDAEGRELVGDSHGEFPIVPSAPSGRFDRFTPQQLQKVLKVYEMVAQDLPVEGRDYEIGFEFPDPAGNPSISMRGYTEIGKAFVQHVARQMQRRNQDAGRKQGN